MDERQRSAQAVVYPPLQRYDEGWLEVGDGHRVHWWQCGHPLGKPALFVHGGPGAGCTGHDSRWFDPRRWRVVLMDQRGAGRSQPAGRLEANDTERLLGDIETLRRHLDIPRWLLFGGSWGATLALATAQRHPQRVSGLVLRGVFTATRRELDWLYSARGAARHHRSAWAALTVALGVPPSSTSRTLFAAAADRLHGDGPAAIDAARAWLQWEQDLMDGETAPMGLAPPPCAPSPVPPCEAASALAMARIGVHYARHRYFIDEGRLLRDAHRLRGVPGVIVQGERDLVTPPAAAIALHRAWPESRLVRVPGAGHASGDAATAQHLIDATDGFGRGGVPPWFPA